MDIYSKLWITAILSVCLFSFTAVPVMAGESNADYLILAKDQTRDRDRLRDRSCLDAIDAARSALERNRIRDAKKEMDKAREECDGDQDRDRDRDKDQDKDKDQDRDRDKDKD